jgi:NADPH:quinone reductase-like Zn-dependent oxidoreductase
MMKAGFPRAEMAQMVGELVKLLATGVVKLPVATVLRLDEAPAAVAASLQAGRIGKVLFRGGDK